MAWIRHNTNVFNHGENKDGKHYYIYIYLKFASLSTLKVFIYRLQYKYLDFIHLVKLLYTLQNEILQYALAI